MQAIYHAIQPASDPMLDFDERDLVSMAEAAGFAELHLDLQITVEPTQPTHWESFLNSSGNPKIPTFAEAMQQALTAEEGALLTGPLQPQVEQGRGQRRMAVAYLWAVK